MSIYYGRKPVRYRTVLPCFTNRNNPLQHFLLLLPTAAATFARMLKRLTAIVLLVALLTVNFTRYFVYAGFELNKKYIAEKLCENRDKPWLHCNGHCYFMKKIKAAEENEKNDARQNQKNLFQEVFLLSSNTIKFHTQLLHTLSTPYHSPATHAFSGAVFRPPQLG